jgi:hypothetical protein
MVLCGRNMSYIWNWKEPRSVLWLSVYVLLSKCHNGMSKIKFASHSTYLSKGKGVPLQARCGQEGSRRFRLPGFMTFDTWRRWGCQPHAPAAFTPRNVPGTHFHWGLSRPQDHGTVGRKYVTEKSSDTTENRSQDRRLVAQHLNHYATPGPTYLSSVMKLKMRWKRKKLENQRMSAI